MNPIPLISDRRLRLGALAVFIAAGSVSAQTQLWDFEEDAQGWGSLADQGTSQVTQVLGGGPPYTSNGEGSLQVDPGHDGQFGNFQWVAGVELSGDHEYYSAIADAAAAGGTLYFDVIITDDFYPVDAGHWFQVFAAIFAPDQYQWGDGDGSATKPVDVSISEAGVHTAALDLSGLPIGPFEGDPFMNMWIAVNGPARDYSFFLDNFRIGEGDGGGNGGDDQWLGYDVGEDGYADTAGWLGNVWVGASPWVWTDIGWLYVAEDTYAEDSGAWAYAPKFEE